MEMFFKRIFNMSEAFAYIFSGLILLIWLSYSKTAKNTLIFVLELITVFDVWGLNKEQKDKAARFLFVAFGITCIVAGIMLLFVYSDL